jgi:hypothetical protein
MFKGGARGRLYFLAVSAVTGLPKALQLSINRSIIAHVQLFVMNPRIDPILRLC